MKQLVHKANIGEILQRIYDSEIHMTLGWCWDGGFMYIVGQPYPFEAGESKPRDSSDNIEDAFSRIVVDIMAEYPDSSFTKWASAVDLGSPILPTL